ncbi:hypothetical protein [Alkalimarinus coralli]|uniref:hypothetical protein n=1 Tax=Alkalimarinus coralli TaxID=2935863 RepID=UPI00202ADD8E|nr:hypothetical protein [Alkalimarinus coralli]
MAQEINCWKCGHRLENLILHLSRREECANCGADQHVCKLCKEYNPSVSQACNEDLAEEVTDKESANFCDYFSPNPHAYTASQQSKKRQAEDELARLFGEEPVTSETETEETNETKSQKALSELEALFGGKAPDK